MLLIPPPALGARVGTRLQIAIDAPNRRRVFVEPTACACVRVCVCGGLPAWERVTSQQQGGRSCWGNCLSAGTGTDSGTGVVHVRCIPPSTIDHRPSTHPKHAQAVPGEEGERGEPVNLGYAIRSGLALASRTNGSTRHLLLSSSTRLCATMSPAPFHLPAAPCFPGWNHKPTALSQQHPSQHTSLPRFRVHGRAEPGGRQAEVCPPPKNYHATPLFSFFLFLSFLEKKNRRRVGARERQEYTRRAVAQQGSRQAVLLFPRPMRFSITPYTTYSPHNKNSHQQRPTAGLLKIAWAVPAIGPGGEPGSPMHTPQRQQDASPPRPLTIQPRPAHRQLCLPAPSASAPICRRGENHLSWALPCSAHVAVSLMRLVLQHLPSRPSCTKGRRSIKRVKSIEGTAARACYKLLPLAYHSLHRYLGICLLRYYAAISSHECDRPHPCPACALSLAWICVWRPSSK